MVRSVGLLGRALGALLALAACALPDAPQVRPAGDEPASVRVATGFDVDVGPISGVVAASPARALVPRDIPVPAPSSRWLPCHRQLTRARAARARRRRALARCRQRLASRAGPDDD